MTANANRRGYEWDVLEPESVLLCRPHPKEPVEIRCFLGRGECLTIKLSKESLRGMAVNIVGLALTDSVAP